MPARSEEGLPRMTIVVGYTTKPEGKAALQRAIVEAKAHSEDVVVLNVSEGDGVRDPLLATEDKLNAVRRTLNEADVTSTCASWCAARTRRTRSGRSLTRSARAWW